MRNNVSRNRSDRNGRGSLHVAFLRNVMVGRSGLTGEALVEAFRDCGASSAESFLATGNIVFEPGDLSARSIADCALARLAIAHGLQEPAFVRSIECLRSLKAGAPFDSLAVGDIHERTVTFFDELGAPLPALPLRSKRGDCEVFSLTEHEAFGATWLVDSRTGNPGKLIEDLGGTRATTRNWNTIERLLSRYDAAESG
jgi:uncharacterized protein (DUF1697 family)